MITGAVVWKGARRLIPTMARLFPLVSAAALCLALLCSPASADDAVPTAWQLQAGTAPLLHAPPPPNPVTICVIDTGITPTPDLDITARRSLLGGTLDDIAALPGKPGHGTVVAHFAAGKVNGWGGAGAFPHARVTSVRIFPEQGGAHWQDYIDAILQCQKIDHQVKVVVLSLGGATISSAESVELENRIMRVRATYGFNVVVAAGNSGGPTDFPARFPASFTVAAVDSSGNRCHFSSHDASVDIAAPGCGLSQAGWDEALWQFNGTSFAAPVVAGVLAALRSYGPKLGPDEAERMVVDSARPGPLPIIDAAAALRRAGFWSALTEGSPRPTVKESPPLSDAETAAPAPTSSHHGARTSPVTTLVPQGRPRLPRPRMTLVRRGRRVVLRMLNRPRGAIVEVKTRRGRLRFESSRPSLSLRDARRFKARFLTALAVSAWASGSIRAR